jgi:hypothetical protein
MAEAALAANVLLKIAVTGVVAPIMIHVLVFPRPKGKNILHATLVIAVAGSLAFQLGMWIIGGILGAVGGLVLFWLVVTLTLDHFCDIDYDKSYAYTGQIVGVSAVLWIIVGVLIYLAGAMR